MLHSLCPAGVCCYCSLCVCGVGEVFVCAIIPKPMGNGSLKTGAGSSGFTFQLPEKPLQKDSNFRCVLDPEDQVLGCLLLEEEQAFLILIRVVT